jgi:osmotically-inducible protein OsmY
MSEPARKVIATAFVFALILMTACSKQPETNQNGVATATPQKGGCESLSDATLTANVKTELSKKVAKVVKDLNVDSKNGVVTLTGGVSRPEVKQVVGDAAKQVQCVKEVVNNISPTGGQCGSGQKDCCCDGECDCVQGNICPPCNPKKPK